VMTTISIATSKKLFDSFILIDDKNSNIEDWLSAMKNKLKRNADWFSIETSKKTYERTRIDEDSMKYLISRFKENSIKSFLSSKKFLMILIECSMILIKKSMLWKHTDD
jgi:hypothetical protein